MVNLSLENRIKEIEKNVNNLKKDYGLFEKNYREINRKKIEKDIQELRVNLNILIQRIRDLRGLK